MSQLVAGGRVVALSFVMPRLFMMLGRFLMSGRLMLSFFFMVAGLFMMRGSHHFCRFTVSARIQPRCRQRRRLVMVAPM